MSSFYITTAIDYINGEPHLGHAYEKIGTDVVARYKRLRGVDVFFCTGTDEHSLNVLKCAEEEGLSPKEYCDRMAERFKHLCEVLHISYDRFIRTTDADHEETVKTFVKKAWDNGKSTRLSGYCDHAGRSWMKARWLKENVHTILPVMKWWRKTTTSLP